jgi:hypothetical protein
MKLRDICHARSGDKGDLANIGLVVYDRAHYDWLCETLTVDVVRTHFGARVRGAIERYELPNLGALNFVLHAALDGGGTRSRRLDAYGKSMSTTLLELEVGEPRSNATEPPAAQTEPAGRTLRVGCGSGFGMDYLEGSVDLVERGEVDYLVFDWISERTLIEATRWKLDGKDGYDPDMEYRLRALLPLCHARGVKMVANWGAADERSAALRIAEIARELGVAGLKIAYIVGSEVQALVRSADPVCVETGERVSAFGDRLVAAHAYQGAVPIVEALQAGADIVVSGRAGDSAQYLAPMMYEFGWSDDDWSRIGKGLGLGHVMECGPHATGGYFADPGKKDVPELWRVGLPIVEVHENGDGVITKLPGTGGVVSTLTCGEQIVYEIGDPHTYMHTDGTVDFTTTRLSQVGADRVLIAGTGGRTKPPTVKINLGVREGFGGVCQTVYSGTGAYRKAKLAADVVVKRLAGVWGIAETALREQISVSFVGVNSIFEWEGAEERAEQLMEVGVRAYGRFDTRREAEEFVLAMFALSSAGPSGVTHGRELAMGGVEELFGFYTTFVPQADVRFDVSFV